MTLTGIKWVNKNVREKQIKDVRNPQKPTYFGYRKLSQDEKRQKVNRHFDSVARRYDFMNTLLSFGIHYPWKRKAVRMMNLSTGQKVLDVCGGTADLSLMAAGYVGATGKITLYDINWDMMAAGRHKVIESPHAAKVRYVQGDAESLPFPNHTYDAAMVGFGIRNVTRMEQGFREMHRVLKPGGKLMCLEFSKPTNPFFCRVYDLYSFYAMPFLGELITGNRQAYTHLPESIRMFPMPDELVQILKTIGFANVIYHRLTNGISVVHLGVKI